MEFHHAKVREVSIVLPYRFKRIGVNLKDSIAFDLSDTSTCGKNPFLIEINLRGRDVTIVEGNGLFPLRKHSWKLAITFRIGHLNLHHFHFLSAPEFPFSCPLVSCGPSPFLEGMEQGEKSFLLSLCIESRPKGIFESANYSIPGLDPEDHRGLKRVKIEKVAVKFHGYKRARVP
jgi:hypothetical protein